MDKSILENSLSTVDYLRGNGYPVPLAQFRSGIHSRAGRQCSNGPKASAFSSDIDGDAIQAIKDMGAAAKLACMRATEARAVAAARRGVHVQTIARIKWGEPGWAIGYVLGMLAL